jgi:murein DD-endopeptidase MepM/ murein hydrolase activator NlpD
VVYRVQRGDNLMKIAKQFGVTAIAMQEANGITDPRSLRVGQELIVPVEEGDVAVQTPTVLPTAVPFGVGGLAFGTTQRGETWGLGEIINTAPFPIEQVRLLISLLDEEGKPIAQAEAAAELPLIVPGGRSPFAVRFQKPAEGFANYTTTPLSAVEGFTGSYYLDLEASDITGMGDRYATYTVSGTLRNTGPEDAVDVVVAVTAYDALGRVIGERVATPEHNVIPRGGATTFRVLLTPIGGPAATFAAVPLGRRIPMPTPDPG